MSFKTTPYITFFRKLLATSFTVGAVTRFPLHLLNNMKWKSLNSLVTTSLKDTFTSVGLSGSVNTSNFQSHLLNDGFKWPLSLRFHLPWSLFFSIYETGFKKIALPPHGVAVRNKRVNPHQGRWACQGQRQQSVNGELHTPQIGASLTLLAEGAALRTLSPAHLPLPLSSCLHTPGLPQEFQWMSV